MWRDDAYLLDIVIRAARKIQKFVGSRTREEFEKDEIVQNAVMRLFEIIGEAAGRVSQEMRDAHSEIPWAEMVGMRNRLIHEYFRIDVRKVWQTIDEDVPALIRALEPIVPPEQ